MATSVDIGLGKSVNCTHAPMTDLSNSIQAPLREREGTTVFHHSRFDYGRLLPVARGASYDISVRPHNLPKRSN
jgi:hypothetical protein